jgi:hypothetical protein
MVDSEMMVICAIRYTMGRRSYIVGEGQRWALEWGKISPRVRTIIIRDLQSDIERCDMGFEALGDKHDEAGWREVLKELQSYDQ